MNIFERQAHFNFFSFCLFVFFFFNAKLVSKVPSTTYLDLLGLHITDNPSWNEHYKNICKKGTRAQPLVTQTIFQSGCSLVVTSDAYLTLVRPKLEYSTRVCEGIYT